MAFRLPTRLVSVLFIISLGCAPTNAEEGIEELARVREGFEKEMAFSTRPIRDRYLSRLDKMKRSFGSRGDARTAAVIQDEIDRVQAISPEPSGVVRFVGVWKIQYTNGAERRYSISADGSVTYDQTAGKPLVPPVKAKLGVKGNDFVVDWGDGSIESLKTSAKNLLVDHFNPKTTYPGGQPTARGVGVNTSGR